MDRHLASSFPRTLYAAYTSDHGQAIKSISVDDSDSALVVLLAFHLLILRFGHGIVVAHSGAIHDTLKQAVKDL